MSHCNSSDAVTELHHCIEKYVNEKEIVNIDGLNENVERVIENAFLGLKGLIGITQANDLLLQSGVLIKTPQVMEWSDNSVQLFYVNHVQIHLRLLFAVHFKEQCDPLPHTYLNSIVLLLNNIRDILSEVGGVTLNEYFTQFIMNRYQKIPLSIQYIYSQIDLNLQEGYYLIDRIIDRSAKELGPIIKKTEEKEVVMKKETLADIAKGRRKVRATNTNPFLVVSMEK